MMLQQDGQVYHQKYFKNISDNSSHLQFDKTTIHKTRDVPRAHFLFNKIIEEMMQPTTKIVTWW